jgi:hypothetical protein
MHHHGFEKTEGMATFDSYSPAADSGHSPPRRLGVTDPADAFRKFLDSHLCFQARKRGRGRAGEKEGAATK